MRWNDFKNFSVLSQNDFRNELSTDRRRKKARENFKCLLSLIKTLIKHALHELLTAVSQVRDAWRQIYRFVVCFMICRLGYRIIFENIVASCTFSELKWRWWQLVTRPACQKQRFAFVCAFAIPTNCNKTANILQCGIQPVAWPL